MAQSTLRQVARGQLMDNNRWLKTAYEQLEPYAGNSDAKAQRDMLLQLAQQNKHAIGLFNDKDTDGALEAKPNKEVVQHACREADELLAAYHEDIPTDDDTDSFTKQPESKSTRTSKPARTKVEDETSIPEESDTTKAVPKTRSTSARSSRQPSPAPVEQDVEALETEFAALAAKKSLSGLEYDEHLRYRELRKQLRNTPSLGDRWHSFRAQHATDAGH